MAQPALRNLITSGKLVSTWVDNPAGKQESNPSVRVWAAAQAAAHGRRAYPGNLSGDPTAIGAGCYHVQGIRVGVAPPARHTPN